MCMCVYPRGADPPAAAYAFLFAANGWGPKQILAPGLLGALVLVGVQRVWTQYTSTYFGRK